MRAINIVIKPDGSVAIKTEGFQGQTCIKETEALLNLLANAGIESKTENIALTPEAYGSATTKRAVRVE
jgi:hypothetical protein